jgi:hypothetical protein
VKCQRNPAHTWVWLVTFLYGKLLTNLGRVGIAGHLWNMARNLCHYRKSNLLFA